MITTSIFAGICFFSCLGVLLLAGEELGSRALLVTTLSLVFYVLWRLRSIVAIFVFLVLFNLVLLAAYYPLTGIFIQFNNDFGAGGVKVVSGFRALAVTGLMAAVVAFLWKNIDRAVQALLFLCLCILLINVIFSSAGLQAKGIYLINSFLPIFLFSPLMILFLKGISNAEFSIDQRIIPIGCIGIGLIGVVYWLGMDLFYDWTRPDLVAVIRTRDGLAVPYGEFPGSWGSRIGTFHFQRIPGTFADPIQWGYFLAFSGLIVLYSFRNLVLFSFFVVLLILSGSKGAILFLGSTIILYLLFRMASLVFLLAFPCWLTVVMALSLLTDTSGVVHMQGLIGGMSSVLFAPPWEFLFGYGIGQGGNMLSIADPEAFSKEVWLSTGAESGLGTMIYQTGILGVVCLGNLLFLFLRSIWRDEIIEDGTKKLITTVTLVYFSIFFIQENLLNVSFVSMLMLTLGSILLNAKLGRRLVPVCSSTMGIIEGR